MAEENTRKLTDDLPVDQLKEVGREFAQALMTRALTKASGRLKDLTQQLNETADGGVGTKMASAGVEKLLKGESPVKAGLSAGASGVKEKVKETVGLGGDGKDGKGQDETKATSIIEQFDVGLPRRVAYDQWTQFADYPTFTSKVESVEQESDEKLHWRAKIFLSHRDWDSTIIEQVPDERIVWRSEGPKGYVDGAVTFHELAPTMTRVLLVAEYRPGGFLEKTANLWRAQGRRLRLEFKHIKRHMMMHTLLEQDEIEGWRGEIRDGEVVKTHEDALKEEQEAKKKEEQEAEEQEPKAEQEEQKPEQEEPKAEEQEPKPEQEEQESGSKDREKAEASA